GGVFFFQAEDGIRDKLVTGVQTCALPILRTLRWATLVKAATGQFELHCYGLRTTGSVLGRPTYARGKAARATLAERDWTLPSGRSEERRVGKECRSWWWTDDEREKNRRKV